MLSSEITLKQFICPVTTCYQDFSFETLISQIQSSKDGIVAIIDQERSPVGIIYGHRLLSLLTPNYPEKLTPSIKEDTPGLISVTAQSEHYQDLITPTPILSCNLKIQDLLPYFKLQKLTIINPTIYLIVDLSGKLLGILNTNKLLNYLLKKANEPPKVIDKKVSLEEDLSKLLDKIPLPIILKSKKGEILYRNLYCYNYNHCSQGDTSLNSLLHEFLSQPLITELENQQQIPNSLPNNYQASYQKLSRNFPQQLGETKTATAKILLPEKKSSNYLKLPLDFTSNFSLAQNPLLKDSYLVIGIQAANIVADEIENNDNNFFDRELLQLNRLKNEFLLNFGHDLKSPLTAIIGLSSLLKAEKLGKLNKRQIDYIDLIYRSGQKLMMIINDLIDMTLVAAEKSEINLESLAIKDICEEVYQQVLNKLKLNQKIKNESFYSQPNINIEIKIHPSITNIISDKVCIEQILTQLLKNALKSTLYQGKIGIKVDNWQQWVAITVWDRGKAIAETKQPLLLAKSLDFKKHNLSEDLEHNLSLIFAQKLAQVQGGDISFTSTIGHGNKFTVILRSPSRLRRLTAEYLEPLNSSEAKKSDSIDQLSRPSLAAKNQELSVYQKSTNLLVLIVETLSTRIEYLSDELHKLGYYPIVARSLEEVLYKATNLQPSKIIINSQLVKTWNQEIITLLSHQEPTKDIPILMMGLKDNLEQSSWIEKPVLPLPLTTDSLILAFPPVATKDQQQMESNKSLTILRLLVSSELEQNSSNEDLALDFIFSDRPFICQHRIIEADSVEQAHMLGRIWNIDAVILDGRNLLNPQDYLLSLQESDRLSKLPIITLDAKTTEAANQINGLSVFPCLLPSNERSIAKLIQVIQIATGVT